MNAFILPAFDKSIEKYTCLTGLSRVDFSSTPDVVVQRKTRPLAGRNPSPPAVSGVYSWPRIRYHAVLSKSTERV